jgi:hypothetical protein
MAGLDEAKVRKLIRAERARNRGVVAGLLGCAFAIAGIFTSGLLFVPLAALCSVIGFVRAGTYLSASGLAISLLGGFLTVVGFSVSPSLWFLASGLSVSQPDTRPKALETATATPRTRDSSGLVSCGSGGCFPTDDSKEAREAADRANEENRRYGSAIAGKSKAK